VHQFPLHEARVDPSAITHNVRRFVGSNGNGTPAVDVRADGYGHGAVEVARSAERGGARLLLVSSASEAGTLTAAGIRLPTLVVSGDDPTVAAGSSLVPNDFVYGFIDDGEYRPAMRVLAKVIGVKSIAAGEGVSYGYTFRASRNTNLALIAIGYANGVDRLASNVGALWLRGSRRPIVGRVAMNALVLDLGDDQAKVEDIAVIFGDPAQGEPSIRAWSDALGKRPTEVAANLGARLPRSST
jgi:alanine racemase